MKLERMTEVMEEKMKGSRITRIDCGTGRCRIFYKKRFRKEKWIEFYFHEFEGRTNPPYATLAMRFE